jgi:hypothetical protein
MDYILTFEDGSDAYLSHHGVKGMKWGVRNAETKAKYSGGGFKQRRQLEKEANEQYKKDVRKAKEDYKQAKTSADTIAKRINNRTKYANDIKDAQYKRDVETYGVQNKYSKEQYRKDIQRSQANRSIISGRNYARSNARYMAKGDSLNKAKLKTSAKNTGAYLALSGASMAACYAYIKSPKVRETVNNVLLASDKGTRRAAAWQIGQKAKRYASVGSRMDRKVARRMAKQGVQYVSGLGLA